MLPFGTDEVTLVQRVEAEEDGRTQVGYVKHALSGCSWRRRSSWKQIGARMERGEEISCRIPAGQTVPRAGDWLFRGEVKERIGNSAELSAMSNDGLSLSFAAQGDAGGDSARQNRILRAWLGDELSSGGVNLLYAGTDA